jgi:altronate dehydratase large subunit
MSTFTTFPAITHEPMRSNEMSNPVRETGLDDIVHAELRGWLRADGRKGIRNTLVVAYLVECGHHVANEIGRPFEGESVHVIGFPGCFPNTYAQNVMDRICTHPNVGAVLLISLGCESFNKRRLRDAVEASGRPVHTITIQERGGTRAAIAEGREWVRTHGVALNEMPTVAMSVSELVIGTICGGSDGTSGITGNPAAGRAFDRLIAEGAACIFEETGELIGCEEIMAARAVTAELGERLVETVDKAARYYEAMGHGSFAPGNADGGLSTIEEKSLGAYAKSGRSSISGILKPGISPPAGGLYLLDVVPDGEVRFGFPNINDNAEIVELISCGCHTVIFVTGRGSVVGSAIAPVIKVCANPDTFLRMQEDMDVNAGRILNGEATLDDVGQEIYELVLGLGNGRRSVSEELGHQEFVLTYKHFDSLGPSCLPGVSVIRASTPDGLVEKR